MNVGVVLSIMLIGTASNNTKNEQRNFWLLNHKIVNSSLNEIQAAERVGTRMIHPSKERLFMTLTEVPFGGVYLFVVKCSLDWTVIRLWRRKHAYTHTR